MNAATRITSRILIATAALAAAASAASAAPALAVRHDQDDRRIPLARAVERDAAYVNSVMERSIRRPTYGERLALARFERLEDAAHHFQYQIERPWSTPRGHDRDDFLVLLRAFDTASRSLDDVRAPVLVQRQWSRLEYAMDGLARSYGMNLRAGRYGGRGWDDRHGSDGRNQPWDGHDRYDSRRAPEPYGHRYGTNR